ncbi:MAG TPA: MMPL family transporter [Gemmataceae bacterium]|nr:MMPL family transporter [Gemmataceae bacterium]
MFNFLGRLAARHPRIICAAWLIAGIALTLLAPRWEHSAQDDDIRFLPGRCDSVRGYRLLEQAFPKDVYASRIILAVERKHRPLNEADLALVDGMVAALNRLRDREPDLQIGRINSYRDFFIGKRLLSRDGQCALIQVSLGTPYLAAQTRASVDRAEKVVKARLAKAGRSAPDVYLTGPAGVGRDLTSAGASSLEQTTLATILLVIVVLLLVHRAPLLALVPLVTIGVSVWVALNILALFTLIPGFYLVNVSQVFAVVMLYGAGTDYCLFLISRYREELVGGKDLPRALGASVGKVGGALAASAATVVCGLGLMGLAEFAKVRCGGPAIALSLTVALVASLTLAPALLRLLGKHVFWPGGLPQAPKAGRAGGVWERISRGVVARPLLVWASAVLVLLPLAIIGFQVCPNYRATGELSPRSSSVRGLAAIQRHFTAGETGPVTVLLASRTDWTSNEGQEFLAHLSQAMARVENIAEVRSLTQPLGTPLVESEPAAPAPVAASQQARMLAGFLKKVKRNLTDAVGDQTRRAARQFYLARLPESAEEPDWLVPPASEESESGAKQPVHVARLDVVLHSDPFDPRSIPTHEVIRTWLKVELPRAMEGHLDGLQAETYGVTVSARDLASVTESDRSRINMLVLAAIFLILLVLVRKPWLAAYLLATVLLSYYATLGATALASKWWSGRPVSEVDWRVPFFLFTILVAVGEDYNILLITRALKERKRHGAEEGMRRALARTGGTITSCGLIMAGTFATLMLAGLNTLVQIGFALAFGVLLDTFLVRPFLVPAFALLAWRHEQPDLVEEDEPAILPFRRESPSQTERRAG